MHYPNSTTNPAAAATNHQRPIITILTQKQQADVPGSVRCLLLSTKRLQDLLQQWSVEQATETQVSDVFVEIGTNFNAAIRAFAYHQIDLRCAFWRIVLLKLGGLTRRFFILSSSWFRSSEIHSIPQELRTVLEQCLGEDPSPAVLETYKPEVRKVIYKLLRGLQARQETWKASTRRGSFDAR